MTKTISVIIFAIFFGLLEAVVVIYLRQIFSLLPPTFHNFGRPLLSLGFIDFLPLSSSSNIITTSHLLTLEIFREASTIVMLFTLSLAVGHYFLDRLAYFLLSFALWDLFYYIFLFLFINWPRSLFDQDIFFLIPVPWVGPVITPIAISLILIFISLFILKNNPNASP